MALFAAFAIAAPGISAIFITTLFRQRKQPNEVGQKTVAELTPQHILREQISASQFQETSSELIRLLVDSAPEAIYGIDLNGNCTFCNPACLRLIGYSKASDVLGRNMHDLIHHTKPDGTAYPVEACHIYEAFRRGSGIHVDSEVFGEKTEPASPPNIGLVQSIKKAESLAPS